MKEIYLHSGQIAKVEFTNVTGNFFAFKSLEDFSNLRTTNIEEFEYIRGRLDEKTGKIKKADKAITPKTGTLMTKGLWNHRWNSLLDCKEMPYVIAYNNYEGDHSLQHYRCWPEVFEGKKLIINDAGDKPFPFPPFIEFCMANPEIGRYFKLFNFKVEDCSKNYSEWRWSKKGKREDWYTYYGQGNIDLAIERNLLLPSPYSPPAQSIKLAIDNDIRWKPWKEREYDIFWAGKRWTEVEHNRAEDIDKIKKIAKKLKLKALIIDVNKKRLKRPEYLKAMANSKVSFSLVRAEAGRGGRREWEILLCGTLMLRDQKSSQIITPFLERDLHFTEMDNMLEDQLQHIFKFPESYEHISKNGWQLSQECFFKIPNVEFRSMMMSAVHKTPVMTLKQLQELETKSYGGAL